MNRNAVIIILGILFLITTFSIIKNPQVNVDEKTYEKLKVASFRFDALISTAYVRAEVKSIRLPFDVDTLINVSLMIMMTIGFTFTYMMEGFPNFAHTSYAGIGAMVTFYLTKFASFNPYHTWPFAAFVGGLLALVLYLGVVKTIRRHRGYQDITLTFTFLIIATMIPQFLYIFNYWSRYFGGSGTRGYNLRYYDFNYLGVPGIAIVSVATCMILILWMRHFLTTSRTGLSLRAVAENEELAATIGINTHLAHGTSWFISGALSALVGSIMTLYKGVSIAGTDGLIIIVMSGAIIGGVYNIYGAIIGGIFVVLAQDLLKSLFYIIIGSAASAQTAIESWQGLFPILLLVLALTYFPNGLIGPEDITLERIRITWERLRKRY